MNSNLSGSIFRLSRLRLSYISGAASKICSILLQILIVPLAISSVGIERFGIFIMIVSACVWLELGGIGIGPGLTHSLSVAWSSGSKINEKSIFSTAFYLSLIISILVLIIALLIQSLDLFNTYIIKNSNNLPLNDEINNTLIIVIIIISLQIFFSISESSRSAYQEDYINNQMIIASTIISCFLLIITSNYYPRLEYLTISFLLPSMVMKMINLFLFIQSKNYLFPSIKLINFLKFKELVKASFYFLIIQLASMLIHNFTILQLGYLTNTELVGNYSILFRLLMLFSSGVLMIVTPFWPSIIHALQNNDTVWVIKYYRRISLIVLFYSIISAFVIVFFSDFLVSLWINQKYSSTIQMRLGLGFYFIIWGWNILNIFVLLGLSELKIASILLVTQGFLVLFLAYFLISSFSDFGLALSLCISGGITAFLAPYYIISKLRKKLYEDIKY